MSDQELASLLALAGKVLTERNYVAPEIRRERALLVLEVLTDRAKAEWEHPLPELSRDAEGVPRCEACGKAQP